MRQRTLRSNATDQRSISERVAKLHIRERQVMDGLLEGETNKEAAKRMGLSWRTIEIYRARLIRHIGARNTAHLVRVLTLAGF